MKTKICFLFLVWLSVTCLSQTSPYYLADSAIKLISTGTDVMKGGKYREGITIWDNLNKKGQIPPDRKATFLNFAWLSKDVSRFKSEFTDLVRNYGFTTDDFTKQTLLYATIIENRALDEWFKSMYDKNRIEYLKDYCEKQWLVQKSNDYELTRSSLITAFSNSAYAVRLKIRDTLDSNDSVKATVLWTLYVDLFETCRKLNRLPNDNDDHHFLINRNVLNLVKTNMEINYRIEEKWVLLRPYIEHACNNGKINPWYYLNMADLHQYFTKGTQLYGTLKHTEFAQEKEIPIEDQKAANEKRAYYGVAPLK